MIEALVALIITAVGILGTVSLQGVILGNTKTANDHSIASLQTSNLVSLMKSNRSYWEEAATPFNISVAMDGTISDNPGSTEGSQLQALNLDCKINQCSPQEAAAYQLKEWATTANEGGFADRLSNASATITRVNNGLPLVFELSVSWSQKQAASGIGMSNLFYNGGSRTNGNYVVRVRP